MSSTNREIENAKNTYMPRKGVKSITLPLTLNKPTESKFNGKIALFVTIISLIITLIVTIFILRGYLPLIVKLIILGVLYTSFVLIINFIVLRGAEKKDAYLEILDTDYSISLATIWGILDTEKAYPYINHYTDGERGIFIRMNKDVKEGKGVNADFEHYTAVEDAYKIAHEENVSIELCDYMENIGEDSRTNDIVDRIAGIQNQDFQNIVSSMYRHLERITSNKFSTFDVYIISTRDNTVDLEYKAKRVINKALEGNYKSFVILNREEVRKLTESLFNLESFSANSAQNELVEEEQANNVRIIKKTNADGTVEVYNKSRKQLREENQQAINKRKEEKVKRGTQSKTRKTTKKQEKPSQIFNLDKRDSAVVKEENKTKKEIKPVKKDKDDDDKKDYSIF